MSKTGKTMTGWQPLPMASAPFRARASNFRMSTKPILLKKLLETWPFEQWQSARVVIAVSGGADSVALLRALHTMATDPTLLHVAHFNHGWRGQESDEDERFVAELCQSLGLSYSIGKNATPVEEARSEQVARKARYQFLREVACCRSAEFIATAHTASDRVETMLHNLCRGTGLAGVCTPSVLRTFGNQTTLVRPMVHCFRDEAIEFLTGISQVFRLDSSNENQSYRRNFLRHSVLPLLRQVYGDDVDQRLFSYSQLAEQSLQVQLGLAQQYWLKSQELERNSVSQGWLPIGAGDEVRLPCATLLPSEWPVVLLALQQQWQTNDWKQQSLTRQHWQQLRHYWQVLQVPTKLRARSPRRLFQLPAGIEVSSLQGWLILSRAC
jgi:tRNA(Ile)-lysidine synthase